MTLIGVLSGLAAVIPYAETIPWLELQTLVVFAAGYLLGARAGALIGAVAMGFYSLANPQGMVHPLVFGGQVVGRALVGAMGGWSAGLGLRQSLGPRSLSLAGWAVAVSVSYDLLTNVASGLVYGQLIPSLVLGIPWALAHLASNVVFFLLIGLPLFRLLDARRGGLVALLFLLLCTVEIPSSRAQAPPDTARVSGGEPATEEDGGGAVPATRSIASDSDSLSSPPQSADSLGSGADSLMVPLHGRPPLSPLATEWKLELGATATWRRGATDSDDAMAALANAPRFYGDAGSVEPLRFSALPGGLEVGSQDGITQWARSTPWQDPSRISDGSKGAWAWAPLGRPAASNLPEPLSSIGRDRRDAAAGSANEPGWDVSTIEPRRGRPLTSVWIGTGSFTRRAQGFDLQIFERIVGVPLRIGWSAWTRVVGPIGEFGKSGAHGSEINLGAQGPTWRWESFYQSTRTSIADRGGTLNERRPLRQIWTRFDWRQRPEGGIYAGGAISVMGEETTGEKLTGLDLKRAADQPAFRLWGGRRVHETEYGATFGWTRQAVSLRLEERVPNVFPEPPTVIDSVVYDPEDLDVVELTLEARARGRTGRWQARVTVERAAGLTHVLPAVAWRGGGRRTGFFASAGGVRATALAEAGKLVEPATGPTVERPNGWIGILGFRHSRGGPADTRIEEPSRMVAALAGGELRLQLSTTAWTLNRVMYPAVGLFGRTILESPAIHADVDGAAVTGRVEWAPLLGLEIALSGYAAAREVPEGAASAAPDYRALLVAGPRFRLFSSTLEVAIQLEADHIGPRVGAGGAVAAITRLGGRLIFNLGDAWLVIRGTDLDDGKHALPGNGADGVLESPGRQIRLYGEWRLLD